MNNLNQIPLDNIPLIKRYLSALNTKKNLNSNIGSRNFLPFLLALTAKKSDQNILCILESSKDVGTGANNTAALMEIMDCKRKIFSCCLSAPENDRSFSPGAIMPLVDHFISDLAPSALFFITIDTFINYNLPDLAYINAHSLKIQKDQNISIDKLIRKLKVLGYERVKYTEIKGEMSNRGGIIDVFPVNKEFPVRIEFFGDQIESLRFFSPLDQTSKEHIESTVTLFPTNIPASALRLEDLFFSENLVFCDSRLAENDLLDISFAKRSVVLQDIADDTIKKGAFTFHAPASSLLIPYIPNQSVTHTLIESLKELTKDTTFLVTAPDEYSMNDIKNIFKNTSFQPSFILSGLTHGFYWKDASLLVMTFDDIFKKYAPKTASRNISPLKMFDDITDSLKKGDIVVHTQYGISRFIGITRLKRAEGASEHIVLEFADKAKLYVPQEQFFMVQKYIGLQKKDPPLDSLHSKKWSQKKKRVQTDLFEYAADLLKLEAERNTASGFSFKKNIDWVKEFENSFLYEDTVDQKKTTLEVFQDMEKNKPMDRLVLGDVGYGKTEIAARAAFKAAVNNKQTAMLVPTTILAEQHGHTFRERMANFPIRIEVLSRFQTEHAQDEIIKDLEKGNVDIIIGTHRLLQKDVRFKNLGLLVIDEEQKFGVKQKNTLRSFRSSVDILTLSATPIPRTLYLSLMGTRNISLIRTPPLNRKPIKTIVTHADKKIIRKAIETEIKRKGQVFIIHNRIKTIFGVAKWIQNISPHAKIAVAHGRMERSVLKNIMDDFYAGKIDVLISTIIIQSGIDIQNVNTMIIHNADMFGLADLYQLRGRIGRADRMAYAYFLISKERAGDKNVQERIQAIKEFSTAGGHFKVALKDLEIRGAGNILGTKQSGHIATIGFDLYCKLLDDTMNTLKGKEVIPLFDVSIDIGITAFIPVDYMFDFMDRFTFYKKAYSANKDTDIENLKNEMRDRFGTLPKDAVSFLKMAHLKMLARRNLFSRIALKNEKVFFFRNRSVILKILLPPEIGSSKSLTIDYIMDIMTRMKSEENGEGQA